MGSASADVTLVAFSFARASPTANLGWRELRSYFRAEQLQSHDPWVEDSNSLDLTGFRHNAKKSQVQFLAASSIHVEKAHRDPPKAVEDELANCAAEMDSFHG